MSGVVLVCVLREVCLGTSFMFSSLEKLQFLLVVHSPIDLTPEWSLRAKVKDSENYLKRPT